MVVVTGGTGTLGRRVLKDLCAQGLSVSVVTRQQKHFPENITVYVADLADKVSLSEAVRHARIVVHCASDPRNPESTDVEGTRNLLASIDRRHFEHFIYVSIAGVDQSTYPYYQVKYEVEKMVAKSGLPWSVLRPTQFHDLVLHRLIQPYDRHDGSPINIPFGMRFQSIDVRDVSERLVQLVMLGPQFREVIISGPEELTIEEMTLRYLSLSGRSESMKPLDHHSGFHDLFRSGVNLCRTSEKGKITWMEFLENALHP